MVLSDLSDKQRQLPIAMLQEAEPFSQDEEDVGYIKGFQMNLTLPETTPVQKTYMSVPCPLYTEDQGSVKLGMDNKVSVTVFCPSGLH